MRAEESKATTENLLIGGELGALLQSHDWSQTSLGRVETWSEELKTAVQIVLTELERAKPTEKPLLDSALPQDESTLAVGVTHDTFRHLLENSPFGVYIVDADFRIALLSAGAQKAFENVRPLIGRDFAEVLRVLWSEPFANEAIAHFRHTLETGEPYHAPSTSERRRNVGEVEWYDWKIERITLADGRFGVVCHFYDLSECQRYEAALRAAEEISQRAARLEAFRVSLTDALRPLADPIEIQATASRVLGEAIDANRVAYFEVCGADYVVEQDYINGAEPITGRYLIDSFDPRQLAAFRQGRTASSSDVPADPNLSPEQRSAFAAIGIGAYIGIPLIKQGEFVAGLAVHTIEPRNWTLDEVALAEEVAEYTWAAVERARAEVALRQSEAQTRNILESIQEAFFALDENWQFTYLNPSAETLLDRTAGDLVGKNIWQEYPGLIGSEFERIYLDAMHNQVAGSLTQFYPDHDRWYDVRTYPAPTGIAVYFRNVTDQIQAEEALRQSEARFRRIFECNMVPIAVWTAIGKITQANDALLDMIGYTRSELEAGQINWQALTPPEYRSLDEIALNEIATKGVSAPYEKVYVCKDGRRIPILIGAASFLDDANSGIFFAIDLTDRKQAKAALQESEERYRTLFESIDQGFCLLEVLFDANDKAYDYRYLEINEAFEEQSGLTNAVGKTIRELVPNLEPQWGECYKQVVKLREAVRFEADVPSMNRVFDIYAVPSGAPGQNLVSVLFTDITQRKRREANLTFLAEIQDDCARLTTADAMMQTIGAKIGAYLNLSVCAFVDIDEAHDQAIVSYAWHRADVLNLVGTYRISEFVSEEFCIAARAGTVGCGRQQYQHRCPD